MAPLPSPFDGGAYDPSFGISPLALQKDPALIQPSTRPLAPPQQPAKAAPEPAPAPAPAHVSQSSAIKSRLRPLTVNEALPYSPFTSIVPFDSNTIRAPTADFETRYPFRHNVEDRTKDQTYLRHLDKALKKGDRAEEVEHAMEQLKEYINSPANASEEIVFKRPASGKAKPSLKKVTAKGLSPFAVQLMNSVQPAYRYPTLDSRPQPAQKSKPAAATTKQASEIPVKSAVTPSQIQQNRDAYVQNAQVQVIVNNSQPQGIDPSQLMLQPKLEDGATIHPDALTFNPSIQIPTANSGDVSQYKLYSEAPLPSPARPLKRAHDEVDDRPDVNPLDQRATSNANLRHLVEELADIFEAEEAIRLNGSHPSFETYFVSMSDSSDQPRLTLVPAVQLKLDSLLHKVISANRLSDIPVDDLVRIQQLCEPALASVDSLDVQIQAGWNEDEISAWLDRLNAADIVVRSARTVLRTMTGGRSEKQLYSEEILQNIIKLVTKITDTCIIPMVEARSSESENSIFGVATANKRPMSQLLHDSGKIMHLLLDVMAKQDFSEQPVTNLEFFVIRLLFVENAPSEKESVLGISKFEVYRRAAMNVLATIFSKYPDQRQFIINEVLTSLQKLPTAKVHARQFRLGDGTRLQLVSVLLVRLVQTSGARVTAGIERRLSRKVRDPTKGSDESSEEEKDETTYEDDDEPVINGDAPNGEVDANTVPPALIRNARTLYESAGRSASQITNFLVNRASTATKSGDQPHRHLLDMFVEDLLAILPFPDWPAAELLLRALLLKMIEILNTEKSSAPAKNMALETLGLMGTAITNMSDTARHLTQGMDSSDSNVSEQLLQYHEDHTNNSLDLISLVGWRGPYRMVLEYLEENSADPQVPSAKAFDLTQWTKLALWGHKNASGEIDKTILGNSSLALRLAKLAYSGKYSCDDDYDPVSLSQYRLAYLLIMLNNHFCKNFNRILQYLIQSCSSDQPRVRTRSLKSVTQMIEKDHSLLERIPQLKGLMRSCVVDSSTTVRDNAIVLVARCIESNPALEVEWVPPLLQCARDSVVGIRKRAIRVLRDVYQRHVKKEDKDSPDLRGVAAHGILLCVDDLDEGTADLAKQIMEEIWLTPFWPMVQGDEVSVQNRVTLLAQMTLVIETVQRESRREVKLSDLLEKFLKFAMSPKTKNAEANIKVCKTLVNLAFDGIIDPTELPGQPEQRTILQTLVSFAHAHPKLFTQQQLSHLQPYIRDLSSSEDVLLFKAIVMIYRSVLPILPSVQKDFLKKIQEDLLKNVTKLGRPELNEAAACLWTINTVLENIERLVNLVLSVLKKLHGLEGKNISAENLTPQQQQEISTIQRLILIAGSFGQHCNFQSQLARFKSAAPWLPGELVAGKIVVAIKAFTKPQLPMALRQTAFDGMGMVCQKWPMVFTQADIARIFQQILRGNAPNLQKIILSSFRDFFATQDEQFSLGALSNERDPLTGKLGGSMTANEHDSAASLISQGFLRDIVQIALSSVDENALTATEVIASITRQGLVHPKECGPALVALETSTNARIAEIAYQQHFKLHQQHESMFEREYMRAIHEAFVYQRDVVKDSKGYTEPDFKAKLHSMYEVVKTSKSKYQGKFLDYYIQKLDFDIAKLDVGAEIPSHLAYSRFLIENLAFFEFGRVQDIIQALMCMERIVQGTGAGISHTINTEIFKLSIDPDTGAPMQGAGDQEAIDISDERLRLLTTASMILTMLWEARTFVRQLWSISNKEIRRDAKAKTNKDTSSRAPTKNLSNITGEKLVDSVAEIWKALDSREASLAQCKKFTDMMTVDSELRIGRDSGGEEMEGYDTPSGADEDDTVVPSTGGSRAKRRGSTSLGGTPSKKKKSKPPLPKPRFQDFEEDAEGDFEEF